MRHVGDECVESVEKGGRPEVEHIHFQALKMGISQEKPDEREAP
jgi:hypothetical protein